MRDVTFMVRAGEVPTSRVYTLADIYADPQFKARDMLLQVPHPTLGHTTQVGIVPRLSATPGGVNDILRAGAPARHT